MYVCLSVCVLSVIKRFLTTKGPNFTTELSRLETELTPEMIQRLVIVMLSHIPGHVVMIIESC